MSERARVVNIALATNGGEGGLRESGFSRIWLIKWNMGEIFEGDLYYFGKLDGMGGL